MNERSARRRVTSPNLSLPALQIQCANTIIDPNAPKRGLSAYMFFAQVCIHPHRSCCITNSQRSGVLTLCYRRTVIRSGTRIPTSPSVCHSISTPYILYRFNSNKFRSNWQNPRWTLEEHDRQRQTTIRRQSNQRQGTLRSRKEGISCTTPSILSCWYVYSLKLWLSIR